MLKILIAGGSGFVGRQLSQMLIQNGYEVAWLTRGKSTQNQIKTFNWDIKTGFIDTQAIAFADVIVNLAGAGVADKKWTKTYKQELFDSRITATALIAQALQKNTHHAKAYIAASAIGIYGNTTSLNANEDDTPATNYLAQLCTDWETSTQSIAKLGIRTATVRVGVVLGLDGGFVKQVSALTNYYLGAALGSGKQYTSWIHLNDLCRMFIWLIEHENLTGIYNGVAPNPVSNKTLTKLLAKQLHKPIILPNAPAFMLNLIFGEMASMLLASQHVSAQKIIATGFNFKFDTAENALANLFETQ